MKNSKGFTFIELLVVITIIAVVFAAGIVSYTTISRNSRDARRRADLEAIRQALEMCRSMTDNYPDLIDTSVTCSNGTVTMKDTPLDPKPCLGYEDGKYSYSLVSGSYTLTADCMEDAELVNTVTNP